MRVAWVSHRDIQSRLGGAEAADDDMVQKRPEGVEVMFVEPGGVSHDLKDFDRVVVTGLQGFTEHEVFILSNCNTTVWAHDLETLGHWLHTQCRAFIALTPMHLDMELEVTSRLDPAKCFVNPGWFDTSQCRELEKQENLALWAHRPMWHKGLHKAHEWAHDKNMELEVMINRPHLEVLAVMSVAKYFVLLSEVFDPGPRAVMEAQLSGCELVLDNVGYFDIGKDELKQEIDTAADRFWEVVLS